MRRLRLRRRIHVPSRGAQQQSVIIRQNPTMVPIARGRFIRIGSTVCRMNAYDRYGIGYAMQRQRYEIGRCYGNRYGGRY